MALTSDRNDNFPIPSAEGRRSSDNPRIFPNPLRSTTHKAYFAVVEGKIGIELLMYNDLKMSQELCIQKRQTPNVNLSRHATYAPNGTTMEITQHICGIGFHAIVCLLHTAKGSYAFHDSGRGMYVHQLNASLRAHIQRVPLSSLQLLSLREISGYLIMGLG